jgi:ActR/RegA family two-component response regulator
MFKRLLLVEPDRRLRTEIRAAARGLAQVDVRGSLPEARAQLLSRPYDWLVTNLRLDAYNGLHLVYLAASAHLPLRILVYGSHADDLTLAREAQRAGAFYEAQQCLTRALTAYLEGTLPDRDRRDPGVRDRRAIFRGGRRCADVPQAAA